jgi:hypothetical protein
MTKDGVHLPMSKPEKQSTVKAVDARTFTKQAEILNKRLPERLQEKSGDCGIHATRAHNNVRSVW